MALRLTVFFILLNLFALPVIGIWLENIFRESFQDDADESIFLILAVVVGIAYFLRFIGLYLKRFPLQARKNQPKNYKFINTLWFSHMFAAIISFAMIWVAVMGSLEKVGFEALADNYYVTDVAMPVLAIFLLLFEAGLLLFWIKEPLTEELEEKRKRKNWRFSPVTEFFADFCLFVYMFVWQIFFSFYLAALFGSFLANSLLGILFAFTMSVVVFCYVLSAATNRIFYRRCSI